MKTELSIPVYHAMPTFTEAQKEEFRKAVRDFVPPDMTEAEAVIRSRTAAAMAVLDADMAVIEARAATIPEADRGDYEIRCMPGGRRFLCRKDDPYPELPQVPNPSYSFS